MPQAVVKEVSNPWSMAAMGKSGKSAIRIYVGICYLANREQKTQFSMDTRELREISGFGLTTYNKALSRLQALAGC